jgi:hypothetical protein
MIGLKEIFLFREPFSLLFSKYISSNNFADETAIASRRCLWIAI